MPRHLRYAAGDVGPLAQNSRHGFAASHALEFYDSGAIYSLIPKNACSALRYLLGQANGVLSRTEEFPWIHQNTHTFATDLRGLIRASYNFTILRCPFRRLASAFFDKIVGRFPPFWRAFPQSDGAVNHDKLTFHDFVGQLTGPRLRADVHWRPQIDFLVYQDYDDWFQLERFDQLETTLRHRLGLELEDTRNLTGHSAERFETVTSADHGHTPIAELAAMQANGLCPSAKSLYDTETALRVAQIYRADLVLYCARFGSDDLLFPRLAEGLIKE